MYLDISVKDVISIKTSGDNFLHVSRSYIDITCFTCNKVIISNFLSIHILRYEFKKNHDIRLVDTYKD